MSVVSKTAETNAVSEYFVSRIAGPKVAGRRVTKGEMLRLSEHQARGELVSGALVDAEDKVDDPWGVAATAKAKAEAEDAAHKVAEAEAAQAAADRARVEADAADPDAVHSDDHTAA